MSQSETKTIKHGVYYMKENIYRMVEVAWMSEDKTIVTVWTAQCMKSGKGFLCDIPINSFKARFIYLGAL